MSDAEDNDNPEGILQKKGEVIIVKPTLTPESEDRVRKAIQKKYYYGGPVGAAILTVLMPVSMIILHFMCFKDSCSIYSWAAVEFRIYDGLKAAIHVALVFFILYVGFSLPIGANKLGEPMMNGDREKYRMRMIYLAALLAPFSAFVALPFFFTTNYSGFQYNHIFHMFHYYLIVTIAVAVFLSVYLYRRSFFAAKSLLNIHGNTGSPIYDFFMGKELQPRIFGTANLKSMIIAASFAMMLVIDVALVQEQMDQRSGFVSPTLLLSLLGNFLLGCDFVIFEENYLTTMTVKHDGVGFNFIFTKLVIFPMLITYHARYILMYQYEMTAEPLVIVAFGCVVGCAIWHRFANADKALFTRYKDHPEVGAYNYILCTNGKRLLMDGWWSGCRHPTYLCAICIALAGCIVTGFSGILPYTYFLYQLIYLVHRIERNEDLCRFEYGEAWEIYRQKVPYKLLRYVY